MKTHAAYLILLALSAGAAFTLGTRVGVGQFQLADAQYQASVAAYELRWLAAGNTEPLRTAREIHLNAGLAAHGRYLESRMKWLWPGLRSDDERAIRNAVNYSLANHYEEHYLSVGWSEDDEHAEFRRQLAAQQRESQQYMQRVLALYAEERHNPSVEPTR